MRGWVHALCALLALLVCSPAAASSAATAQLRPQPVAVVLTKVRLISESADESRFELSFDPAATSFAPIASQATQPSIGFALATRGRAAVQPSGMKGLVRKYYLYDAESHIGGGCYLWESREAAGRFYDAAWRKMITENYGRPPELEFFETAVVVDNS